MLNRSCCIWVLSLLTATFIVGCGQTGNDLIVLQDGSRQTGTLRGCVNASCQLNEQTISQATIAWIGLSYAGNAPPSVVDPATDEIHTRDGSVESGRLVSVGPGNVVTVRHSFERTQVAWIHLAPAPGGSTSGPEPETLQPGTTIFHYDVEVTGHEQSAATETGSPNPDWNGTTTTTVDWITTFKNVVLHKNGGADTDWYIDSGVPDVKDIEGGTTDVKFAYEETKRGVGACHETIQLSRLGSYLMLEGDSRKAHGSEFTFHSGLDHAAGDLETTIENKAKDPAGCIKQPHSWPSWDDDLILAVVRGLKIRRSYGGIYVIAERTDPYGPLLFPLKELAIGDAFSFTTGKVQRSGSINVHYNWTAMTEIKVNVNVSGPSRSPASPASEDACPSTLEADSRLETDRTNPDLQYKAWAACVERARCKKTPESACANKKPPGNWPDLP